MSEGTTFTQWRERAQTEIREESPNVRVLMITAAIVVVVGILGGTLALLLA